MNELQLGTGIRKTATARVYLKKGKGELLIKNIVKNKNVLKDGKKLVKYKSLNEYFLRKTARMVVLQPLELLDVLNDFDVKITVEGGGIMGQAGAIRHGITRALIEYDENYKPALKKAGYVTRDPREVERKKVGHRKARKVEQYSKR